MTFVLPPKRYLTPAVILLITLWLWVLTHRPYSLPKHVAWSMYANIPVTSPVFNVFDFPPLSSKDVRDACESTDWNLNQLVATCVIDGNELDVAEIRNMVLSCVRYSMAAGIGMVMPELRIYNHSATESNPYRMVAPGLKDMPVPESRFPGLDYMFDQAHFSQSLALSCPQLKIYQHIPKSNAGTMQLDPHNLRLAGGNETYASQWRIALLQYLAQANADGTISPDVTDQKPLILELKNMFLSWPVVSDKAQFNMHFGQLLKVRSDMMALATTVLDAMKTKFGLDIDLNMPILENAYIGAYLDTRDPGAEASEIDREYAQYDAQVELYLDQAARMNISLIYVASAIATDIPKFVTNSTTVGITTVTQFDLLKGRGKERPWRLKDKELSLVDFLVFGRGSGLVGVGAGKASTAWNLALRRHLHAGSVGPEDDGDGLSWIFGDDGTHEEFVAGMWP